MKINYDESFAHEIFLARNIWDLRYQEKQMPSLQENSERIGRSANGHQRELIRERGGTETATRSRGTTMA